MNSEKLAKEIMENVGGSTNVTALSHCSTRLRFTLSDKTKVNLEALKNLTDVAGAVDQSNGVQVIIGTNVSTVYNTICSLYTFSEVKEAESSPVPEAGEKKLHPFQKFMNNLADCFVPLIPALIAAGLMSAVVALIDMAGIMDTSSTSYQILDFMADAPLYFIPFMLAYTASKKFNVNSFITMAVTALLLYPSLSGLYADGQTYVSFFNIPIRSATYSSSVVPVLLVVWAQRYVEKAAKKFIPQAVATFLEPLLTYFVLAVITLAVLGPLSGYLSDGIAFVLNLIIGKYNWLVGLILGFCMIPLISTGLHYSTMPIVIAYFTMNGHDTFWSGPAFCSNLALAGAVLAVAVTSKDAKLKQTAYTTGCTALLGITEPAIYSVALGRNKILLATCIGGGIGGLVSGILGVNAYGMAPAGLTSLAILIGPTFLNAIISIAIAFCSAFALAVYFEKFTLKGKNGHVSK